MATTLGLHHVTAMTASARTNLAFYRDTLGLDLVKKTVNFDDPSTYHLYYGSDHGVPGSIMTFFPWEGMRRARRGTGEAGEVVFYAEGSPELWRHELTAAGHAVGEAERWGKTVLTLEDPDGLPLALELAGNGHDTARARTFSSIALKVRDPDPVIGMLTDLLDYEVAAEAADRFRLTPTDPGALGDVDVVVDRSSGRAAQGAGGIHHVAFRVADDADQEQVREKLARAGLMPTSQIDRQYFRSIYWRGPEGLICELATDPPGFTVDEPAKALGKELRLPPRYEAMRGQIEQALPVLD